MLLFFRPGIIPRHFDQALRSARWDITNHKIVVWFWTSLLPVLTLVHPAPPTRGSVALTYFPFLTYMAIYLSFSLGWTCVNSDAYSTCVWGYFGLVIAAMPFAEWLFRSVDVILAAHVTSNANTIRRNIHAVGIHISKTYRLHQNQTSEIFQQSRCHLKTLAARMKIERIIDICFTNQRVYFCKDPFET
jgi:hypothetical protein